MDPAFSVAAAVAVKDGKFVAVGTSEEIRALKSSGTQEFDLQGQTVLPGFNDTHNHMLLTGLDMDKVQLGQARTLSAVLDAVKRKAETSPEGEWIVCSSAWHESQLADGRLPNCWELDAVSPRHPVYLPRGGHTLVVNSLALKIAGIDKNTANPPGGDIKKDPTTGEPTGLLFEPPAMSRVLTHLPPPTLQQKEQAIVRAMQAFNAAGITSLIEPGLTQEELDLYRTLRSDDRLTIRTSAMVGFGFLHWPRATTANIRALGRYEPSYDPVFHIDGIKMFVDGGIETALLTEPYCIVRGEQEDPNFTGAQVVQTEELQEIVTIAHQNHWRMGIHAVGDAGIELVLNAYARVHQEKSLQGRRFVLIHGILPKPEHFARLRDMGIVVTSQVHNYALGGNMIRYWGLDRASRANPVREYLDHEIPIAGGTDSMVCPYSQLLAVWSQITRKSRQGETLGAELSLTREQAFKLHTAWGSYITFEERIKGTIEEGKYADFVVLSQNPFECPVDELEAIKVVRTVMGGRTVFAME